MIQPCSLFLCSLPPSLRAVLTWKLDGFFFQKGKGQFHFPPQIAMQKGEFAKNKRHPKMLPPLVFRKRANHKSRNAQPQSEPEPQNEEQNEARFADCAILGDRRLSEMQFDNLEKPQSLFFGENRPNR